MTNPTRNRAVRFSGWRRLCLGLLLVIAVGVVLYRVFLWGGAEPPAPDLSGVDPAVRQAIEEAQAEVRRSPRSGAAWGRLGMVFSNHVFGNDALVCFLEAERLDAQNPRWPYYQALIQLDYDPPSALEKLARAVELTGAATDAPRVRLAELYAWLGQEENARQQFQTLLEQHPNHPRAHLGLARLRAQAGQAARARAHLQIALINRLTQKSALALSAELYQRAGQHAAALQERARLIELPDEPDWPDEYTLESARLKVGEAARLGQAGRLLDHHRYAEAMRLLNQVVADYPKSAPGWTLLGWAYLEQKQVADAERCLQTALELDSTQARAWLYRGVARFQQHDRREAIACFRKAIAHKAAYLEAHFNLGLCLKEEGDRPGAIAAYQEAVRCQPLSAPAHAHLGELLWQAGRTKEAVVHLEQAVALNPQDSASRKLLERAPASRPP